MIKSINNKCSVYKSRKLQYKNYTWKKKISLIRIRYKIIRIQDKISCICSSLNTEENIYQRISPDDTLDTSSLQTDNCGTGAKINY